jgi:transcriptional regulator with XRE-family HTH domain
MCCKLRNKHDMEPDNIKLLIKSRGINLNQLARDIGVDKATVSRWCSKTIPAERVKRVSEITGIPRHVLRPDIFEAAE